jgi:uncharacterized membrane protein (DUF4010 family)
MTSFTALPNIEWNYLDALVRMVLALALGLLIGLERERRRKEAGLRTFGFVCLLGALGGTLGGEFALTVLLLTGLLTVFLNIQTLREGQGTELTTSAALLVTSISGILCGQGHTVTPAAVMVLTTALLAWKERLNDISMGLTESEMRSALLLAILAIVIYPALPAGAVGPWRLVEPRAAWVTVMLVAGIASVNYVLWKIYGERSTEISGFLGGLVNSNFTINELIRRVNHHPFANTEAEYRACVLATGAMLVRNSVLLGLLAPLTLLHTAAALALMLLATAAFVLTSWAKSARVKLAARGPESEVGNTASEAAADAAKGRIEVNLELPFSLPIALKYGLLFLLLNIAGNITERELGEVGFYAVSFLGGLMSSASAVAAAGTLAAKGAVSPEVAGTGAVIASLTSALVNLPFVLRSAHGRFRGHLAAAMIVVALLGILGATVWKRWLPVLDAEIPLLKSTPPVRVEY